MKKITIMLLMLFAVGVTSVMAQGRTVSGKVVDSGTDLPIIGATIIVEGTQNGAYSLDGGEFVISNVEGAVNLEVAFMGYTTGVIAISATQTNVEVELTPSAMTMDEVVVIAYGSADKKSLTGSVAVISSEKLEDRPLTNVSNAIAGMSSGIMTTAASGVPGEGSSVRIRGISTINSSSTPLYVVDGMIFHGNINDIASGDVKSMTVLKDAASTALYGSRATNGVIMIETKSGRKGKVQFDLKITQGFQYRSQEEYDQVGVMDYYELAWEAKRNEYYFEDGQTGRADELASEYMFNNSDERIYNILQGSNGLVLPSNQVIKPTAWGSGTDKTWTRGVVNPDASVMEKYAEDLDWLEDISRLGYRQSYSVSASGGTDKTSYYTSIGYTDEEGYIESTSYNRLNARAKVDATPTKWLKLGTNLAVSMTEQSNPLSTENSNSNPFVFARNIAPVFPIHLHDMNTGEYILDPNGDKIFDLGQGQVNSQGVTIADTRKQLKNLNPIFYSQNNEWNRNQTTLNMSAYLAITFLKDFKFTIDGSFNNRYSFVDSYETPELGSSAGVGEARNEANRYLDTDFRQMLEWGRQFGKHNVSAIAGHIYSFQKYHYLGVTKRDEIFPGSKELDNFASVTTGDVLGLSDEVISETYIARANYNYDEKYYLMGSFSRDGISKLSPENRWGNFWSVGGAWIVSSEDFMSNAMWVDFLKLRVSYGTNGNSVGIERYQWMGQYNIESYGGDPALDWRWGSGTPNLKWETNASLDIGVDFRLFNRLNGTLGFYDKRSHELIFDVPVPYSTGQRMEKMNIGSMVNRGIELSLDYDVIRSKDWVWNVGMNLTWQQNRILNLPEDYAAEGIDYGSYKRLAEGSSIYEFYLRQFAGIDAGTGSTYYILDPEVTPNYDGSEFKKDGKDYTYASSNALRDFSGDALSPIYGSLSTSLTWKALTLDVLFTYRLGGSAIDYEYQSLMTGKYLGTMSPDILNSWRKPGDVTSLPRIQNGGGVGLYSISTRDLIDNSYIALQNITLSYEFPKRIANKLTLSGLSIYASGENLFQVSAIKGYDAMGSYSGGISGDSTGRYGSAAVISFGINISF